MAVTTSQKLNKYSSMLTQTISQVGSQAMLYGVGLSDEDMKKPQVGIASMGWEGNTCNMHLNALARRVKQGVQEAGQVGLIFHTIGVSDGISMGTAGMKLSLLSRDIIADSIEAVMRAQWYDANISLPRLRQEHAGRADGHGPPQPAQPDGLRGHDSARPFGAAR